MLKEKINNVDIDKNSFLITYIFISMLSLIYIGSALSKEKLILIILAELVLMITEIITYFILKKILKKNIKIHNLYLILIIIIGTFYIFGFPPSQLPDDVTDYLRALEVSEFHATSIKQGNDIGRNYPINIVKVYESNNYKDYINNRDLKLTGEKSFLAFANKSLYAFVCYIPQAIGVGIGRLLSLPIVVQIILGKMFNFALFVLLSYLSIKYIPIKKELLFFICLLPITVQEATSLSADCMTISTAIALASFVIWSRASKQAFKKKHLIGLSVLVICLSLSKIVYLPLCFLILLIPRERFGTKKNKIIYCSFILLLSTALNIIWLNISSTYLETFMISRQSNSTEQLKYILNNPLKYIIVLCSTIEGNIHKYLAQMVGYYLGAFTIRNSSLFTLLSLIILGYLIISREKTKKILLSNIEKIGTILILLVTILLIFTSLYLQWTPLYAEKIEGIQGRYFIPLLPVIAMLYMRKNKEPDSINSFVLITSIIFNIISIISIYGKYLIS